MVDNRYTNMMPLKKQISKIKSNNSKTLINKGKINIINKNNFTQISNAKKWIFPNFRKISFFWKIEYYTI